LFTLERNGIAFLGTRKDLTVETEPLPHPTVVWVTVAGVQHSPTRWTYTLTEANPGSLNDGPSGDRPLPSDKRCDSYFELFDWLCLYGFTPPPPGYFAPTPREQDEGAASILRPVMTRIR